MFIRMIRDKDNLKRGRCYNVAEPKAIALLTEGYCVRGKDKLPQPTTLITPEDDTPNSKRKK